ncbi:nucleotide-diphospho-sugar transferase [Hyaloraphidium curvatum]|nr:nucleotide-diphospho-sugar transferase [Hyaloraphidium curvatum]
MTVIAAAAGRALALAAAAMAVALAVFAVAVGRPGAGTVGAGARAACPLAPPDCERVPPCAGAALQCGVDVLGAAWLAGGPPPLPCQAAACALHSRGGGNVSLSIVVTAFRSAPFVGRTIRAVVAAAVSPAWELIVVIDGKHEPTEAAVLDAVRAAAHPGLRRAAVLLSPTPVFETASNNLGLRAARGQLAVLFQDDIFMRTKGFDAILALPFQLWDDVAVVSGRCAHGLRGGHYVGRCGVDVNLPLSMGPADRAKFHVRDTVNRGPYALRTDRARELGFFDELNFHLGDDDHDLACRAYATRGWVAGSVAIDFDSPLALGATRRPKEAESAADAACAADRKARRRPGGGFLHRVCHGGAMARGAGVKVHDEERDMCARPATGCEYIAKPMLDLPDAGGG